MCRSGGDSMMQLSSICKVSAVLSRWMCFLRDRSDDTVTAWRVCRPLALAMVSGKWFGDVSVKFRRCLPEDCAPAPLLPSQHFFAQAAVGGSGRGQESAGSHISGGSRCSFYAGCVGPAVLHAATLGQHLAVSCTESVSTRYQSAALGRPALVVSEGLEDTCGQDFAPAWRAESPDDAAGASEDRGRHDAGSQGVVLQAGEAEPLFGV